MKWRIGLIDSCGIHARALDSAAFLSKEGLVECRHPLPDPSLHGSRIADLLCGDRNIELLLGQVFTSAGPTSAAAVAAAIDWAVARDVGLIHLSLGLKSDRAALASAIQRAIAVGCVIVAASPARGAVVYPAAYPGVIRATGDARCALGEVSSLGPWLFGACPRFESSGVPSGGASIGAAWVSHYILKMCPHAPSFVVAAILAAAAKYRGPESKR
jgi:hypothetical protein